MLKTPIKASQITNLTDARYFAAMGVKWMGFNFDTTSFGYTNPTVMAAIKEWVEGPAFVGEFGLQSPEAIKDAFSILDLDMIQLNMLTPMETVQALDSIPKMMEIIIEPSTNTAELTMKLAQLNDYVECFILNFDKNKITWNSLVEQRYFELSFIKSLFQNHKILLSIDLESSQLASMLTTLNPLGLSVVGGEEEQVGVKSFEDLDKLFEALEME